jgi:hypothetical protein
MLKPVLAGFTGRKALADTETERNAAEAYYRGLSVCVTYNGHGFDDHVFALAFKHVACSLLSGLLGLHQLEVSEA